MTFGNRMSALPVAEFCPGQASLPNVGGRSAIQSSAFHALLAKKPEAEDLLASLTEKEREELVEWHVPTDVHLGGGDYLRYEEGEKELELELHFDGVTSVGHLDVAWVHDGFAYVVDMKRSLRTALPDNLQNVAYGHTYAVRHRCRGYVTGIWGLEDGEYAWADPVLFGTPEANTNVGRLEHAVRNKGTEFTTGSHCSSCWARWRCPAFLVPSGVPEGELDCLKRPEPPSGPELLKLLTWKARLKATLDVIEAATEHGAKQLGGIPDGKGMVWKAIPVKGRESLDKKALFDAIPEAKRYIRRGADFEQHRWVKDR